MEKDTRIYVGLDVHQDTIAVCWLRGGLLAARRQPRRGDPPDPQ